MPRELVDGLNGLFWGLVFECVEYLTCVLNRCYIYLFIYLFPTTIVHLYNNLIIK